MGLGRVITLWRGVSAGLDRGDTPRDACVEHIFPILVVTQARRVHAHALRLRDRAIAQVRSYQVAIAAIRGLTPMIFITRVRL